ncbi:MAG: N-acetylmuramoyl-L-alanine amidase [Mailhella sp.]|nr:N-acetylmuramoyl-L-alanine amidase [Mailhella sp.]
MRQNAGLWAAISALVLACALLLPHPSFAAADPDQYLKAKAAYEDLLKDKKRSAMRDNWEKIHDEFQKAYRANPKWPNRPAALFHAAKALEQLAVRSGGGQDARKAIQAYLDLPARHKSSALADDALYRAAEVYWSRLGDKRSAVKMLERLASEYPQGDFMEKAAVLGRNLGADIKSAAKGVKDEGKGKSDVRPGKTRQDTAGGGKLLGPAKGYNGVNPPINVAEQFGLKVKTIVLDAGHGGNDPGTQNNGIVEKIVTLDMVKRTAAYLRKAGYTVLLTRENDKYISLPERGRFAGRHKADLFVSLHVNANSKPNINGLETYYLNFTENRGIIDLAARENALLDKSLGQMNKILTEMLLTAKVQESRQLAKSIQNAMLAGLKKAGFKNVGNGGVKGAPFYVLIASSMPAVLVEIGYCTNQNEAKRVADANYREVLAASVASGIADYAKAIGPRK